MQQSDKGIFFDALMQGITDQAFLVDVESMQLLTVSQSVYQALGCELPELKKKRLQTLLGVTKATLTAYISSHQLMTKFTLDNKSNVNQIHEVQFDRLDHLGAAVDIAMVEINAKQYLFVIKHETNNVTAVDGGTKQLDENDTRFKVLVQNTLGLVFEFQRNQHGDITFDYLSDGCRALLGIEGDVREAATLEAALLEAKPDIVFHLAAQSMVLDAYQNPAETYATNVMGTVNILEAVRKCETVKSVVIVTSDKCYDNKQWHWGYRENDAMGGSDPYSSSKGCAELVVESYRHSFFNPDQYEVHGVAVASARAGNVIGGGDWAKGRLIPDVINAFNQREPIMLRNPESTRPWQHVLEPLGAYMLLAERMFENGKAYAEAWNFGPNEVDTKPTGWIINLLASYWKEDVSHLIQHNAEAQHEAVYLRLDCAKARSKLGWYPISPIEKSIESVADWYVAYQAKQDMYAFSLQQIQQYQTQWSKR